MWWEIPKPLLDLLKPFEILIGTLVAKDSFLYGFFFELFSLMHKYLYEYPDYLLFGIFAVPLYYLVPKKYRVNYLTVASFAMISLLYGLLYASCLLLFPLIMHFLVKRFQERAIADKKYRHKVTKIMVVFVLAFYGLLLLRESLEWQPMLPLFDKSLWIPFLHVAGIAFMLPKLIHYIVDSLQGKITNSKTSDFALFMIFFPILRLGPIERFQNFVRDIRFSEINGISRFDIAYGLWRILIGVLKTMLFAWYFYPTRLYATDHIGEFGFAQLYSVLVGGPMEIYLHFGGYTDIAIGFSRMLGFKMMENFYMPILSRNMGELWRRWHISLSFWLRDYVFLPLGGSKVRGLMNVIITFFICGVWHKMAWNFAVWGLLQAFGLVLMQMWGQFWRSVDKVDNYMDSLKPLVRYMKARPRLSYALALLATTHYFALTGLYFVLTVDQATYAIMRVLTFGAYVR